MFPLERDGANMMFWQTKKCPIRSFLSQISCAYKVSNIQDGFSVKKKTVCVSTTLCVGQRAHAGLYACVKSSVICEQVLCVKGICLSNVPAKKMSVEKIVCVKCCLYFPYVRTNH